MQDRSRGKAWFPAFAGMSGNGVASRGRLKGPHLRSFPRPTSALSRESGNPDFHASPIPREGLGARLRGNERKRSRLTRSIERPSPPLFPRPPSPLFPAKAGTQTFHAGSIHGKAWAPAFAGMSGNGVALRGQLKGPHLRSFPRPPPPLFPAKAGTQTFHASPIPREGLAPAFAGMSGNGVALRLKADT